MKRVLYFLFVCVLVLFSTISVYAEDRVLLTVTTHGDGQIKVDYDDEELYFSEKHPIQKVTKKTPVGTKFKAGAKAAEGYVFKKWTLDGEDYSTEKEIIIAVTRNMNLEAVFEVGTEEKVVDKKVDTTTASNNILLYIGLGVIGVLVIAIVAVALKRKK